jgi:F-type H+-transporting ATPase subunit delta
VAVAHRLYARALFEAARDAGRLDAVREELADFVAAVRDVPELRSLLENPQLDPAAKRDALQGLLADADEVFRNFMQLLVVKGRAAELEEIAAEFEELVAREQGRLNVALTTAKELSDSEAGSILQRIERSSGRTIDATRHVDPSLIGGIVLQAGSLRIDASVRGRLERLRNELVTGS